jgi:hypothetical protein
MMQYGQSFSCSVADSSLEHPSRGDALDHLADTVDTIHHRLLVDDHLHVPEIGVPTKQPQDFNETRGLAITQQSYQCPQEIASKLTISVRLRAQCSNTVVHERASLP